MKKKRSNAPDDTRRVLSGNTHTVSVTSVFECRGFTFIEILITLAIIAICFLPLMRMYSVGVDQAYATTEMTVARYLAQEGMEKLKNLGFTESQIERMGEVWDPPFEQPPLSLNGKRWRVLRSIAKGTDPLQVRIRVYQITGSANERPTHKPLVELITLIEDIDWTAAEEIY